MHSVGGKISRVRCYRDKFPIMELHPGERYGELKQVDRCHNFLPAYLSWKTESIRPWLFFLLQQQSAKIPWSRETFLCILQTRVDSDSKTFDGRNRLRLQ